MSESKIGVHTARFGRWVAQAFTLSGYFSSSLPQLSHERSHHCFQQPMCSCCSTGTRSCLLHCDREMLNSNCSGLRVLQNATLSSSSTGLNTSTIAWLSFCKSHASIEPQPKSQPVLSLRESFSFYNATQYCH